MHKNLERQTVELCLQILKTQPTLGLNTSEYESWVETCPDKAVEYLALVLDKHCHIRNISHQNSWNFPRNAPRVYWKLCVRW